MIAWIGENQQMKNKVQKDFFKVKIKDIQKLVKDHVKISDKELDDIDRLTNWRKVLFKQKSRKDHWEQYNVTVNVNEYGYRSDNFDGDEISSN